MRKTDAFRRAAALLAALSITVSLAAPAFADIYYIDDGDITITKYEDGRQTVKRGSDTSEIEDKGEIIITTREQTIATQESDLEGPAAEDSGFGPVVEDNYQPAQPEDAEEPEGADQPESAEEQESAGQRPQPQQAAPAAAPAAPAPVNPKGNGVFGNIITVINKCADKALKLTLKDVKIDVSGTGDGGNNTEGKAALSVQGKGNVEIELDGDNVLKSGLYRAGLEKNTDTSAGTLTLKDDKKDDNKKAGSLTATGGKYGAGIGGGDYGSGENITITGGTVTAAGGYQGAGIGGGQSGSGKNITINGGTVNAAGGDFGAGIGGGYSGSGENITINSGTVTAAGGDFGAGIGGGNSGSGEAITINGGTVNATGGLDGAGIGGGDYGSGEAITIKGGTVNAAGGQFGAGIGGGNWGSGEDITIKGGTVEANGGLFGAGIGGGNGAGIGGSGKNITINGGTVNAAGGDYGAGIGGGCWGSGSDVTVSGGTVKAVGGISGAGIGGGEQGNGGYGGIGSNVTVSGAAQVTAIAGKPDGNGVGAGATIGNGGSVTEDGDLVNGEEIQADISGLTTGYIHHIIYNEDGSVKQEWWEYGHLQPAPDTPNAPAEESNGVSLGTPGLHVETLEGDPLPFDARQQGSTLRVTSDNLAARLHGNRQALEALREQGVEQIQFVTSFKTTTLSVEDLLAEGGSWFALEHDGLVSRRLSAAQAESLKCRMR